MKEPRIKFPTLYISKASTFSFTKVNLFFIDSKYDKFSSLINFIKYNWKFLYIYITYTIR